MMIWFAGILQYTCCNKTNENKTNKKMLSFECGVFYTITRVDCRVISYKYSWWFDLQVSYKILVVIRPVKIKQKIKTRWVVIVVSFTQLRALTVE